MEINGAELLLLRKIIKEAKKEKTNEKFLETLESLETKVLNARFKIKDEVLSKKLTQNEEKKNIETIYFHRFKEDNFELFEKYKNDSLRYLGLEVEMDVEIDNTGDSVCIVSIEGQELKEKITL